MLRTLNVERTLWEAILPKECLGLPAEPGRAKQEFSVSTLLG
jgi:hypothetical protein